jgi:hypothetical protein
VPNNSTERLLNEIGQLLAENAEYPLADTLLYSELDKNFVSIAIFVNRDKDVLYRDDAPDRLTYALLELWEAEDPGKRWAEIEYVVRNGEFEAEFTYADEIDPEEDSFDRRDRIVERHFGDKPIVYPPPPSEDDLFEL